MEIKKKSSEGSLEQSWSMIKKQKKFSHAHSGLQSDGKQKTVKLRQIKSKATLCRHSCMVDTIFFLPPGQVLRAFKITNKMSIPQNHGLTSIDFTKNPCT